MANRKSGKELRKEYRILLDKTKAMQKRLIERAGELIKQYPDVKYSENSFITVSRYCKVYKITPMNALDIIEKIEQHIADQHPHQQTKMFVDNVQVKSDEPYIRKSNNHV